MSSIALIPGAKSTVHAAGLDAAGHQVDLPSPAGFSIDNAAVATAAPRADLTNAADVIGVAAGTATLTITSGALSTTVPIVVAADAAVSIETTVDPMVAATEAAS